MGSLADRASAWRGSGHASRRGSLEELFRRPRSSAIERLHAEGFSAEMIDAFFRPFFGGILLDRSLSASSRMLEFVFRMMAEGDVGPPGGGHGRHPGADGEAPARKGRLRLGARVAAGSPREVRLESGETLGGDAVVVATEGPEAARLTGCPAPGSRPVDLPLLRRGTGPDRRADPGPRRGRHRPVNNLCFPTPGRAGVRPGRGHASCRRASWGVPPRHAGEAALEGAVREQMEGWFGGEVRGWRHLRTYHIRHAQPEQRPGALEPVERPVRLESGLFVCGDHRDTASLHGAMVSGRRAAEAAARATLIASSFGPCPSSNAAVRHASVQRVGRRHRRRPRT